MFKRFSAIGAILGLAIVASAATGQDAQQKALNDATKARQAQMQLYAFNLGQLGAMAKGEVAYDSAAASAAATNLASLARLDQSKLWPEGSDEMGVEGSRALPALWENLPDVMSKGSDLVTATTAMEAAAGTDLASLQAAMGAVGGAGGACHKAYRGPSN